MEKDKKSKLVTTVLHVAWLSLLLGLGMEVVLLIAAAIFGKTSDVNTILAEIVQKVSWSTFVCLGVAMGTAATRFRAPAMGIAGFIAAPIAFHLAKILHKSAAQALSVALVAGGPSPVLLGFIKAIEYGVLGFLLGKLEQTSAGFRLHAVCGLGVGFIFGCVILGLIVSGSKASIPLASLFVKGVNEILFPVGCALVVYFSQRFAVLNKT